MTVIFFTKWLGQNTAFVPSVCPSFFAGQTLGQTWDKQQATPFGETEKHLGQNLGQNYRSDPVPHMAFSRDASAGTLGQTDVARAPS